MSKIYILENRDLTMLLIDINSAEKEEFLQGSIMNYNVKNEIETGYEAEAMIDLQPTTMRFRK